MRLWPRLQLQAPPVRKTLPSLAGARGRRAFTGAGGRRGAAWLPLIVLVVLVLVGAGVAYYFLRPRPAKLVRVRTGTVVQAFYATGTVAPNHSYTVQAKTQGNLIKMFVRRGDRVYKNQLLGVVEDWQLKFAVASAQAALTEAQARAKKTAPLRQQLLAELREAQQQYAIAHSELAQSQRMFQHDAASVLDVDAARQINVRYANAIAALKAQLSDWKISSQKKLAVAQAALHTAQANLADAMVRCPINGIVLKRYVETQDVVHPTEDLFVVANPQRLIMQAAVDEQDIAHARMGQRVDMQLYAYGAKIFHGHVMEIMPTANIVNKTFEVKVQFNHPPATLRPGMTAQLNFIRHVYRHTLLVPATALDGNALFVPQGDGYHRVPVRVGVKTLRRAQILAGVKAGQKIVGDARQVARFKRPKKKPASGRAGHTTRQNSLS